MSYRPQPGKSPISERISIFEQKRSSSSTTTGPAGSTTSSSSHVRVQKTVVSRTFSGKNFEAIKSQFDSGVARSPSSITHQPREEEATPPTPKTSVTSLASASPKTSVVQIGGGADAAVEKTPSPRHVNQNIDRAPNLVSSNGVKGSPFRQQQQQPAARTASGKRSPTANAPKASPPARPSPAGRTATKTTAPTPGQRSAATPTTQQRSVTPTNSSSSSRSSKARNDNGSASANVRHSSASQQQQRSSPTKPVSKSQTTPIQPVSAKAGGASSSPSINMNTVTINLRKTTSTAEVNTTSSTAGVVRASSASAGSSGGSNSSVSRVVREKAMTAPIVPTVSITVEPPSPKTSVTEAPPEPPARRSSAGGVVQARRSSFESTDGEGAVVVVSTSSNKSYAETISEEDEVESVASGNSVDVGTSEVGSNKENVEVQQQQQQSKDETDDRSVSLNNKKNSLSNGKSIVDSVVASGGSRRSITNVSYDYRSEERSDGGGSVVVVARNNDVEYHRIIEVVHYCPGLSHPIPFRHGSRCC